MPLDSYGAMTVEELNQWLRTLPRWQVELLASGVPMSEFLPKRATKAANEDETDAAR